MTLVELLIVVALIAMLMSLLLPAVNAARESGRQTTCRNNLRQLALAMANYEASTGAGTYPSNGWGWRWVGEPDRSGVAQTGGWVYSILPQLERQDLREIGLHETGAARRKALGQLMQISLAVLRCPNRASFDIAPQEPRAMPFNADAPYQAGRTDYAVNEGDFIPRGSPGPPTLEEGDSGKFPWPDTSQVTGICFVRSQIAAAHLQAKRGLSNVLMLGEKHVSSSHYFGTEDPGYDQSPFCGNDLDITRWTASPPQRDAFEINSRVFGSAHPSGCNIAFCDASVRHINYSINAVVFAALGNRKAGLAFGDEMMR
jgi:prepilin-type processing-associated H-X9-DG protein